jgi:hypothetical protein
MFILEIYFLVAVSEIDCACIGVIFDSTLERLIILLTLDGVGLKIFKIFFKIHGTTIIIGGSK